MEDGLNNDGRRQPTAVDDDSRSVDLWCAIVPNLHDKFILRADAVSRLSECNAKLSWVTTRSSSKSVNASHDDNVEDSVLDDDKSDDNINVQTVDDVLLQMIMMIRRLVMLRVMILLRVVMIVLHQQMN